MKAKYSSLQPRIIARLIISNKVIKTIDYLDRTVSNI